MSCKPKVSVVTVTYNAAALIERTILSVLAQGYRPLEYLVIDGGSTDGTREIVGRYGDRVDIFISESDEGIFDAMNKSLGYISGSWVNFMNAGDTFVDDDVVTKVAAHLGGAHLVCGDSFLVYEGSQDKIYQKAVGLGNIWKSFIPCVHQALFAEANWMKTCCFDVQYKYAADYDFLLKSYVSGKAFKFLDFPIANFLFGGASKKNEIQMQLECLISGLRHSQRAANLSHDNVFFQGLVTNYYSLPGANGSQLGVDFNRKFQFFVNRITALAGNKSRIVVYGAGSVGKAIVKLIPGAVVFMVDRSPSADFIADVPVITPDQLIDRDDYDVVLISVLGRERQIIEDLTKLGIPQSKLSSIDLFPI